MPVGIDVGAYAWTGMQSPVWQVTRGFKDSTSAPTVKLSADSLVVT